MHRQRRAERGTGLIGTVASVAVFLAFLTVALQLLLDLYTTSVVTAATYDAARAVAEVDVEGEPSQAALAAAEDRARDLLGGLGGDARFTWDLDDPAVVRLRVEVPTRRFVVPAVSGALGFDVVDRTVVVRREQVQP